MVAPGCDRPGTGRVWLFDQFEKRQIRVRLVGCRRQDHVNNSHHSARERRHRPGYGREHHSDNGRHQDSQHRRHDAVQKGGTANHSNDESALQARCRRHRLCTSRLCRPHESWHAYDVRASVVHGNELCQASLAADDLLMTRPACGRLIERSSTLRGQSRPGYDPCDALRAGPTDELAENGGQLGTQLIEQAFRQLVLLA